MPLRLTGLIRFAGSIAMAILSAAPFALAQRATPPSTPPGPPAPTPRLGDGTPNLGREPGEKGSWGVPWIRNMGLRIDKTEGGSDLPSVGGSVGLVGHGFKYDGSRLEPSCPFLR